MDDSANSHEGYSSLGSFRLKIDALIEALRSEQVRWLVGRTEEIKSNSGMSDEAFRQLVGRIARREAERSMIISELRKGNKGTIERISSATNISQKQLLKHMVALMKRGSVTIAGESEREYMFSAVEPPE